MKKKRKRKCLSVVGPPTLCPPRQNSCLKTSIDVMTSCDMAKWTCTGQPSRKSVSKLWVNMSNSPASRALTDRHAGPILYPHQLGAKLLGFRISETPKNDGGNPKFGPGFTTGNLEKLLEFRHVVYIVACQRGGVSNKLPDLQAATRHSPLTL